MRILKDESLLATPEIGRVDQSKDGGGTFEKSVADMMHEQ
jgi:hypothetical protein